MKPERRHSATVTISIASPVRRHLDRARPRRQHADHLHDHRRAADRPERRHGLLCPRADDQHVQRQRDGRRGGDQHVGFAGSGTHTAIANPNLNKAITDAAFWLDIGPSNKWAMFDSYNGTVTSDIS
jgi:hypothetical protein